MMRESGLEAWTEHLSHWLWTRDTVVQQSFQVALGVKSPPASAGHTGEAGSTPGSGRSPEQGTAAHSSILAWETHGQRSLTGYSSQGHRESDTTEVIQQAWSRAGRHRRFSEAAEDPGELLASFSRALSFSEDRRAGGWGLGPKGKGHGQPC